MSMEWRAVTDELARWRDDGRRLPVWWRDDDAIAPTPALDRLLGLAGAYGAPITIASIPRDATDALAARLRSAADARVSQHGWAHANHAPSGEKSAEFGAHRPLDVRLDEIARGWARIQELFGDRATPVFTPPWNRIAPDLAPTLAGLGLTALSTFKPRAAPEAAPGVAQINTHLDPIDWRGGRDLVAPDALDETLAALLRERRLGAADNDEPLGLLTHHLVHTEAVWGFTDALLQLFAEWSDVVFWCAI